MLGFGALLLLDAVDLTVRVVVTLETCRSKQRTKFSQAGLDFLFRNEILQIAADAADVCVRH